MNSTITQITFLNLGSNTRPSHCHIGSLIVLSSGNIFETLQPESSHTTGFEIHQISFSRGTKRFCSDQMESSWLLGRRVSNWFATLLVLFSSIVAQSTKTLSQTEMQQRQMLRKLNLAPLRFHKKLCNNLCESNQQK